MSNPPTPPVTEIKMQGLPLTDDMRALFAPWGILEGVTTTQTGMTAAFKGGYVVAFFPTLPERNHD